MSTNIKTLLENYHIATLGEIANAAGIETMQGGRKLKKRDLLPKIEAELFTQAHVEDAYPQLSETDQAALNRLLLRGGKIATASFKRELIRVGLAKEATKNDVTRRYNSYYAQAYNASPERKTSTIFEDIIARLTLCGLVFSEDPISAYGGPAPKLRFTPGQTLIIPEIIRPYLPPPEPVPIGLGNWQPDEIKASDATIFLRDLYIYWDFVRQQPVPLIQGGFVGKRSLKSLNKLLLAPELNLNDIRGENGSDRLFLLRQLLETLNLVHKDQGKLQLTEENQADPPQFWHWHPLEQLSACLEAWLKTDNLQSPSYEITYHSPSINSARTLLIDVLKTLPTNTWLDLDELIEWVREKDVNFLYQEHRRIENHTGGWYYSHTASVLSGNPERLLETLNRLEADFVGQCLIQFLYPMGVVDLGYLAANKDQVKGFRLTDFGGRLLGVNPVNDLESDTVGKLILQPNFQLMAMGPVSLATLAQVDRFAERTQVDRGVFEYHLTRESVYKSQQAGFSVEKIIEFLEAATSSPLPQNIQRSLDEWGAHHERIIFRTGVSLLQAADEQRLSLIQDRRDTGKHLARALTPTVSLIKRNHATQLATTLINQELFPAVAGAEPTAADKSVIIAQDGIIQPIHAVPSLHLRGRLTKLAEPLEDERWQLTKKSIRRAGGSRKKVQAIIAELQTLHRGTLPKSLITQIQNWGGYYGQATAETLTLIEFQSREILDDLLKKPELGTHLVPFTAANRALAAVETEYLAAVTETLAEFGVTVKEGIKR